MSTLGLSRLVSDVAQSIGAGPIEALCLSDDGPKKGKFVPATYHCPAWKLNKYGAVGEPPEYGEHSRWMYDHECRRCEGSGLVFMMPDGHEVECSDCQGAGFLESKESTNG